MSYDSTGASTQSNLLKRHVGATKKNQVARQNIFALISCWKVSQLFLSIEHGVFIHFCMDIGDGRVCDPPITLLGEVASPTASVSVQVSREDWICRHTCGAWFWRSYDGDDWFTP